MCRYLALVTALASEADFVFIPEWPPHQDWASKMCKKLLQARLTSVLQHYNMMHECISPPRQLCFLFNCINFVILQSADFICVSLIILVNLDFELIVRTCIIEKFLKIPFYINYLFKKNV